MSGFSTSAMRTSDKLLIARIAARYRTRWCQGYARGKLQADPAFAAALECVQQVEKQWPGRPLLDVGCGLGLLAFFLREHGLRLPVQGVDLDQRKIDAARDAAASSDWKDLRFNVGDALDAVRGFRGHVFLLDVVHYLPPERQNALLGAAATAVAEGGTVFIRNALADGSWRHRATALEERLLNFSGWIRPRVLHFPTREGIARHFPPDLFTARIEPLWGWTPFNSYLLEFTRRA